MTGECHAWLLQGVFQLTPVGPHLYPNPQVLAGVVPEFTEHDELDVIVGSPTFSEVVNTTRTTNDDEIGVAFNFDPLIQNFLENRIVVEST